MYICIYYILGYFTSFLEFPGLVLLGVTEFLFSGDDPEVQDGHAPKAERHG